LTVLTIFNVLKSDLLAGFLLLSKHIIFFTELHNIAMNKTGIIISRITIFLILILLPLQLDAQKAKTDQPAPVVKPDSAVNLPNFLLPRFTKSVIKLKSGEIYTAVLNYNTVEQEMFFQQKDKFFILDEPQLVDTVFMANKIYVPFEKGFYEVIVIAPVTLFYQHKSYVEFEGTPTLYGAKSQTMPPSNVNRIYGARGPMDLKVPNGYKVFDDSSYWIRKDNKMSVFESKRQFLKIFPEKEKELSQYIDKNKTDFKSPGQITELVNHCNELYK
jgi:hypothetical protein